VVVFVTSVAVPILCVVYVVFVQPFGRISLFFTFLFTVESFVSFTMCFSTYALISFAGHVVDGIKRKPWLRK
jgi:hypothetical protein